MTEKKQSDAEIFNTLFFKACEDHTNGDYQAAKKGYEELLKHFQQSAVLLYNLGLLLFEIEDLTGARDALQRAVALAPEDPDILFNLALCCRRQGDVDEAIRLYRLALEREPESLDIMYNLSGCFREQKEYAEAASLLERVLSIDPDYFSAWNNLAHIYQVTGELERAVNAYQKVLELQPDKEGAAHMLRALTGVGARSSPASYVREVFDNYSERYEASLVGELGYEVPARLRSIFDQGCGWKKSFQRGLDLGCGTGLSGIAFADIVQHFRAVDLSSAMVEQARAKNIYDSVEVCVIEEYLLRLAGSDNFDFFVAADVFCYLGELDRTLQLLAGLATGDALLCFSTETGGGGDSRYLLQPSGRFAHSRAYIEESAGKSGWRIVERQATRLRKEQDRWMVGDLWFLSPQKADVSG
ncbi:MAG: hypothetical protein CSB23_01230 [Deltaproteobacteria bacterium]|nr:MAG: hypothetical protein CSB23_01230 [Deltaproteobacteria bacterium]